MKYNYGDNNDVAAATGVNGDVVGYDRGRHRRADGHLSDKIDMGRVMRNWALFQILAAQLQTGLRIHEARLCLTLSQTRLNSSHFERNKT